MQLPHLIWADADLLSAPPETTQQKDGDQSIRDPTSCKTFTTYYIFPASHPVLVQPWVRDAVLRWSLWTFLCLSDHIIARCEISWRPLYNESMGKAIQTSTFWTLFDWWLDSYQSWLVHIFWKQQWGEKRQNVLHSMEAEGDGEVKASFLSVGWTCMAHTSCTCDTICLVLCVVMQTSQN